MDKSMVLENILMLKVRFLKESGLMGKKLQMV